MVKVRGSSECGNDVGWRRTSAPDLNSSGILFQGSISQRHLLRGRKPLLELYLIRLGWNRDNGLMGLWVDEVVEVYYLPIPTYMMGDRSRAGRATAKGLYCLICILCILIECRAT